MCRMQVRALFFAGLREGLGRKDQEVELEAGATLADLLVHLRQALPLVDQYAPRLIIAVNAERAPLDRPLADGDEVAFLPPMSGGSNAATVAVWLQSAPLSLDPLLAHVRGPDMGGVAIFIGAVRNHARGESIDHLEYEAYAPMAEKEMRAIAHEVEERWPDARVAISHRLGRLEIGDDAVMIAAAAPHRADAFAACRHAIDTLKARVPIFKKEFATSGSYWVEENP